MGLGSGIRKKLIPDPEVKKHRIQDPDPQQVRKRMYFGAPVFLDKRKRWATTYHYIIVTQAIRYGDTYRIIFKV
jgi:hypothetical protein